MVREVLRARYLTRQRRTVAPACRDIARQCKVRGLRVPSRGTVLRRIAMLDPVKTVTTREGRDAARARRSAGGTPPEVTGLLEQVQADHTPVDVIVVDEKHPLPVGRPYLTLAISRYTEAAARRCRVRYRVRSTSRTTASTSSARDSYSYGEPQSSAMHLCARALLPIFAKAG